MQGFEQLSKYEFQLLQEASARVMLLLAGADGKIDREEKYWSGRLLRARAYTKPKDLNAFYEKVANDFSETAERLIQSYPKDPETRAAKISSELEALNHIFPKLDGYLAAKLYKGLLALAEETARASGGFLRFGAVADTEKVWLDLPMLMYVPMHEGMEEEDEWEDWDETDDDE